MTDDDIRQRNLSVVQRAFAAITDGDLDRQLGLLTDDVVLELPYADPPVRLVGKQAVRDHVGPALQSFSFRLDIDRVHECRDPDLLVLEYSSDGKATTTGEPYANTYVGLIWFRDGRICAQREYYNPLIAARSLRLL